MLVPLVLLLLAQHTYSQQPATPVIASLSAPAESEHLTWRSPFFPALPAWLGVPNGGVPPTAEALRAYLATGNKSALSLWSTVAAREAHEAYWGPLALATMLTGKDAAADAARLRLWAQWPSLRELRAFAVVDALSLGCLSNLRFVAHAVSMTFYFQCTELEALKFVLFHTLTAAPLSWVLLALALGSVRRGALAALGLLSLTVLAAAAPLQLGLLAEAPGLVAASAAAGILGALLL